MSMLLEAVHRVNLQRAAALLARGADVNTTDAQGVTPLIIACERGELKMLDLLLKARASTKMVTNDTQSSCLHIAAKNNAAEIVLRLLEVDPTIEERATSQGDTALMVACLSAVETEASSATLNALLQPRLTTTTSPSNKATSAPPRKTGSYASAGEGKAPVAVLGPDDPRLVARNRHGHTALHCAAFSQSPTAVRLLLEAGADCTIGDKAGRTAVEVALNLNKKKATALREGARGGSVPAAECLRLLKERWAKLENEAKERQRALLGELEDGEGGERGGNGRASGATTGKKSTRKKRKKQQQQQQQQQQQERLEGTTTSACDADGMHVEGGVRDAATAAVEEITSTAITAAAAAASQIAPSRRPIAAATTTTDGLGNAERRGDGGDADYGQGGTGSDSEGKTDDEAGSHPSSEAETGSHEGDPADRTSGAAAAEAAAVMASLTEAEEAAAAAASAAGQEGALAAGATSKADGSREHEVDEAWSVVARPARKKKTALPPPPAQRPSSRPASPPLSAVVRGVPAGRVRAFGNKGPQGFVASRNRSTDYPALPAREAVSRGAASGLTAMPSSESRVPSAAASQASTPAHAACETAASAAAAVAVASPRQATASDVTPVAIVAAAASPTASTVVDTRCSVSPRDAAAPAPVEAAAHVAADGQEEAVPVVPAQSGSHQEDGSGGGGGNSNEQQGPLVRRQLNVNANAWQPPIPSPPPPPPPLQQPMQHHMVMQQQQQQQQQQMRMHPSAPPPPVLPPMSGGAPPMGLVAGNGLRQHHQQQQQQPPPPPVAWGPQHHQVLYNHPGGAGGNAANFGHNGFAPMPQPAGPPPPMHMHPTGNSNSMAGDPSRAMMMPPPPPPPLAPHAVSGGGVMMGARPEEVDGMRGAAAMPDGAPMPGNVASVAQGMLEASSPQAQALALRVEHLVWGMEAMSAGLSMAQLDTLKAVLLDQVGRVDEAKLEQVRVQERSKSEEKTSILNQLQHFQHAESESESESPAPANGGSGGGGDGEGGGGLDSGAGEGGAGELSATAGAVGGHTDGTSSGEGEGSQPGESNNDGLQEAAEEEPEGEGLSRVAAPTAAQ